jgi:hypothetical protein
MWASCDFNSRYLVRNERINCPPHTCMHPAHICVHELAFLFKGQRKHGCMVFILHKLCELQRYYLHTHYAKPQPEYVNPWHSEGSQETLTLPASMGASFLNTDEVTSMSPFLHPWQLSRTSAMTEAPLGPVILMHIPHQGLKSPGPFVYSP